jgi:redox-sensitive bicupin YhaK (pirin superfamily)
VPEVVLDSGVTIKVICGAVGKHQGPVRDIVIEPEYLDVTVPSRSEFVHGTKRGHTVFVYVIHGKGYVDAQKEHAVANGTLALFADGDQVKVTTEQDPVRFLLVSGRPLKEPVAWYGPIVMNTEEELETAFEEYRNGTFIKRGKQQNR